MSDPADSIEVINERKVAAMCRFLQSGERGMGWADDVLRDLTWEYENGDRSTCAYPPAVAVAIVRAAAEYGDARLVPNIERLAHERLLHKGWQQVRAAAQECLPQLQERAEVLKEQAMHDEEILRLLRPVDDPAAETLLRAAHAAGTDTLLRAADGPDGAPHSTVGKRVLGKVAAWLKGSEVPQHTEEEYIERLRRELLGDRDDQRRALEAIHVLVLEVSAGLQRDYSESYVLAVVRLVRAYGRPDLVAEMQRLGNMTPRDTRDERVAAAARECCEAMAKRLEAAKQLDERCTEEARLLLRGAASGSNEPHGSEPLS